MRILVVEDEQGVRDGLVEFLGGEGYEVVAADCVARARDFVLDELDLVLLDWRLPDGQGLELLKAWRAQGVDTPVIFLTARADLIDKVLGFEMGADDYVTKPFEPRELLARIRARLRSPVGEAVTSEPLKTLSSQGVELDLESYQMSYRGAPRDVTRMEFKLLQLLMESPGRVFSRDELLNRVWGFESYPNSRTVDTHVLQLRQKLHPELIETVRGIGYRWIKS